ncbi:hypothetical protein EPN52_03010 [bacterium]|nr:MAG: hypothetical protein EPN52_03010 [bacterium]
MSNIASVSLGAAGAQQAQHVQSQTPALQPQTIAAFKSEQLLEAQKGVRDGDEPIGATVNTRA